MPSQSKCQNCDLDCDSASLTRTSKRNVECIAVDGSIEPFVKEVLNREYLCLECYSEVCGRCWDNFKPVQSEGNSVHKLAFVYRTEYWCNQCMIGYIMNRENSDHLHGALEN